MTKQWSTLGEKLCALRKGKGVTLKILGKVSGLSVSYLSDIERDRTQPSLKTLQVLADAYGTEVSKILSGIM